MKIFSEITEITEITEIIEYRNNKILTINNKIN
jgi:hypothetical protein